MSNTTKAKTSWSKNITELGKINEAIEKIYEKLSEGFYPEEYHKFCSAVEYLLSDIEDSANQMLSNTKRED